MFKKILLPLISPFILFSIDTENSFFSTLLQEQVNSAGFKTLPVKERWTKAAQVISSNFLIAAFKEIESEVSSLKPGYKPKESLNEIIEIIRAGQSLLGAFNELTDQTIERVKNKNIPCNTDEISCMVQHACKELNMTEKPVIVYSDQIDSSAAASGKYILINPELLKYANDKNFTLRHEISHIKHQDPFKIYILNTYSQYLFNSNKLEMLPKSMRNTIRFHELLNQLKTSSKDTLNELLEKAQQFKREATATNYFRLLQSIEAWADIEAACANDNYIDEGIECMKVFESDIVQEVDCMHPAAKDRIAYLQALKKDLEESKQ